MELIKFGTPVVSIPEKMDAINKKGKHMTVNTLTKKGNLRTNNGEKAIQLKSDKSLKNIVITAEGEKIIKNMYKKSKKLEKFIKDFNVDDEIKKLDKMLNKKPRKPRKKKEEEVK